MPSYFWSLDRPSVSVRRRPAGTRPFGSTGKGGTGSDRYVDKGRSPYYVNSASKNLLVTVGRQMGIIRLLGNVTFKCYVGLLFVRRLPLIRLEPF